MYFEASRRRAVIGFLLPVLSMALLGGCGHKGPPIPPPLENPAPTSDLALQQRGSELIVSFSYPQTTLSGELLTDLTSVEYWELVRPLPEWATATPADEAGEGDGGESGAPQEAEAPGVSDDAAAQEPPDEDEAATAPAAPQPSKEELVAVEPLEFHATAQLRLTLEGAELESAIVGDSIVMRFPLDAEGPQEVGYIFAVRTYSGPRSASPFSNLATLVRRTPPPPPEGFAVEAVPLGIHISWDNEQGRAETADAETTAAPSEGDEGLKGFHVYRRDAQSRNYDKPLVLLPPTASEHYDRSGQFGNRYIYTMTAVAETVPLIESALAGEREIDYQDRFAPPPPVNLVALAEAGRVRLLWDASRAADVAGYVVFRRRGEGEFLRLNAEPVTDAEYTDVSVASGSSYDYQVAAVDQIGNLSEPSEPATARVP